MSDKLKDEGHSDRDPLERHLWRRQREAAQSRCDALQPIPPLATATSGGERKRGASRTALRQPGPILKPTPPELFRTLGTNRETRFEAFKDKGYLTPTELFFIRNHTSTPLIDVSSWRLRIDGNGVRKPLELDYDDLLALPAVTRVRCIECAGNGRSFFGSQQGTPAPGAQWQLGAIGVAEWTGVPLAEILRRAGLKPTAVDVQPEGLDAAVGTDGHVRRPLPIEKALDDVLVVYGMNGEQLPPDHGFPARLLVPGWVGIASIKWLGRIEVSEQPLFSPWNTTQYRLTGAAYPDGPALTAQEVKSAFELPLSAQLPAGSHMVTGRSWSAHGSIRKVEVSFDDGNHYRLADMHGQNHDAAWAQWRIAWPAEPGSYVLRARATDSRGNVQPDTVPFNANGYLFSAVARHPVRVT